MKYTGQQCKDVILLLLGKPDVVQRGDNLLEHVVDIAVDTVNVAMRGGGNMVSENV